MAKQFFFVARSLFEPSRTVTVQKRKMNSDNPCCSFGPNPKKQKTRSLFEPSCTVTVEKRKMISDNPCCSFDPNPKKQKTSGEVRSNKVSEEEEMTRLSLYTDPWKIKKTLTQSDVNNLCRLCLSKESIHKHVIPLFNDEQVRDCGTVSGTKVTIFDFDTKTEHKLTLKSWKTDSYYITSNWKEEFKKRRKLEEGDEIGLFWNPYASQFFFTLLNQTRK